MVLLRTKDSAVVSESAPWVLVVLSQLATHLKVLLPPPHPHLRPLRLVYSDLDLSPLLTTTANILLHPLLLLVINDRVLRRVLRIVLLPLCHLVMP